MKTVKFGGSSLADSGQFEKVRDIILEEDDRAYVVVSAPGKRDSSDNKVTDLLTMVYELASHGISHDEVFSIVKDRFREIKSDLGLSVNLDEIFEEMEEALRVGTSKDYIISRGEHINAKLLADYIGGEFVDSKDMVRFNDKGEFDQKTSRKLIDSRLKGIERAVIPGFYGSKANGEIVVFSRGGSDISGSIISDAMDVELYENWTDVPGFLVASPQIVEDAKPIETVTYSELRELSYMGAPVLHEEAIFPVREKGISINIRDTNNTEAAGTMIVAEGSEEEVKSIVTGISGRKHFTAINIEKTMMNQEKGFIRKVISVFEANDVNIEHIPSCIDSISIIVADEELKGKEDKIVGEIKIYTQPDAVKLEPGLSLLTVVGRGMVNKKGTSARVFTALYNADINVKMITQGASELSIIVGVATEKFENAIKAIYESFESWEG